MRFTGWLLAILIACGLPVFAQAAEITGAHIVEYGIYKGDLKRTEPLNEILAGRKSVIYPPELVRKTITVPAKLNTSFGYYFVLTGQPNGEKIPITYKIIHSSMQNPYTGKTGEGGEYTKDYEVGTRDYIGFRFGEKWELAPGKYTLMIFFNGRPLLEKTFSVILPSPEEGSKEDA